LCVYNFTVFEGAHRTSIWPARNASHREVDLKRRGIVMRQHHFSRGGGARVFTFTLLLIVLLHGSHLCAAQQDDASQQVGVRGFSPKHISAQQGKRFLAALKIGTVSQLPGTNMLLVTGQPGELVKAVTVLELVDTEAKDEFVVEPILPAIEAKNLPSTEQIAAVIGNTSLGDFAHPPRVDAGARGIIDVHNDMVMVIAPASLVEKIVLAIDQLQNPQPAPTPPPQPAPQRQPTLQPVKLPEPNAVAEGPAQIIQQLLAKAASEAKVEPNETSVEPRAEPESVPPAEPGPAPSPKIEQPPEQEKPPGEVAEPVVATSRYEMAPIPNGNETLRLDLPDNVDIIMLLGLAGEYLGLDFMYDPNEIKGGVTLKLQGKLKGPIKVKDLYPLLESALNFRGFVMTRKENLVTIVPKEKAMEIDPILQAEGEKIQPIRPGDVIITSVFELKHVDTDSAKNLLEGMKLGTSVEAIPNAKKLIVTEYAYRMPRIEQLLQMIDKPGEPKKFRFRQLRYTMARTLAEKVKTLAEQLGTVSISIPELAAAEFTPSPKRSGESDAAYNARIARERALWQARQRTQAQRQPTTTEPEPVQPTVYLDADERTNRVLMIGLEEQLHDVEELIDALDVEQQDLRTLQVYKIEHVGADEVKEKLQEFGIITPAATTPSQRITPAGQTAAPPPSRQTRGPTTTTTTETEEALVEEPQVVVIAQTNSLLVNATKEQHVRIVTIIGYVDAIAEAGTIPYVVYPLENQDPNALQAVLEQLILETTETEDKEAKIVTTEKTRRRPEDEIVIVADSQTYSLIVYASKENQQWIKNLIEQLDEYRPQVLLDVTLVEITKNEEFSLDLDLVRKWPRLEPGATMEGPGLPALLDPFPEGRIIEAIATAGGGAKAFYADQHVQALLEAIQQKGYGRILARPKLLVNDNQEGIIKSEEETSIVREETQVIPGTAATAPTYTTQVGFETYKAGITLTITPHISKGNQLQLMVNLNRTDFRLRPDYEITSGGEKRSGPTPPDLLSSDVTSKVTVPDGTTIILGGLETLKQSKGGTKVPILGDIPLIGGLFRSVANSDAQSRLYVFVKAHILRPGEELTGMSDIEIVSKKNRDRFERYEEQMQNYEDWPGIRPKPMDPVRVLEVD